MHGYLRMRVAQFLSVLRPWKHTIYLSRHGESTYNIQKKLGGDPPLSPAGEEYAQRLGVYAECSIQKSQYTGKKVPARLWTSSLQRTELTAAHIPHPSLHRDEVETPTEALEDLPTWRQMRHRVFRNLDEICKAPASRRALRRSNPPRRLLRNCPPGPCPALAHLSASTSPRTFLLTPNLPLPPPPQMPGRLTA
jgi:hypothetical protein